MCSIFFKLLYSVCFFWEKLHTPFKTENSLKILDMPEYAHTSDVLRGTTENTA